MSEAKRFISLYDEVDARIKEYDDLMKSQVPVVGFPLQVIPGRMNTIVAPSHSGKTIYGIGLAMTLAREGKKVMLLSTEEGPESFIAKTRELLARKEEFLKNITTEYIYQFDKESVLKLMKELEKENFDHIIIDYFKKSMWKSYSNDHQTMEEINAAFYNANQQLDKKLGMFVFVQGNREAFDVDKNALKDLVGNEGKIALMIDGGMPAYRTPDNVVFIRRERGGRKLFVAKSRFNHEELGKIYNYNVDLVEFKIIVHPEFEDLIEKAPKRRGSV